jgi:hypothetical protein
MTSSSSPSPSPRDILAVAQCLRTESGRRPRCCETRRARRWRLRERRWLISAEGDVTVYLGHRECQRTRIRTRTRTKTRIRGKGVTHHALFVGYRNPDLVVPHRIEHFECLCHAHKITRVVQVHESPAELRGLPRRQSLSSHFFVSRPRLLLAKASECRILSLTATHLQQPSLPGHLRFPPRSLDTRVHGICQLGPDTADTLVGLGGLSIEVVERIIEDRGGVRRSG